MRQIINPKDKHFLLSSNIFLYSKTDLKSLPCLFNVVIPFNSVFYLKLNFKLRIDPKTTTFKNLEEILKTWRKFAKNQWPP